MPNYVFAYSGGNVPETEEEQASVMAAWTAWLGGLGESLVDIGNPFGASASVASDGTVSDHTSADLSGYSVIAADDLDAAIGKAKSCPILASGGRVDVYEAIQVV